MLGFWLFILQVVGARSVDRRVAVAVPLGFVGFVCAGLGGDVLEAGMRLGARGCGRGVAVEGVSQERCEVCA